MFGPRSLACSFCGRRETEVAKLVAGPRGFLLRRVYICDACVGIASRIMAEANGEGTAPASSPASSGQPSV